jgi:hypothetical protein
VWKFHPSTVYDINAKEFSSFDSLFSPKEKGYKPTQEEYNIASNAFVGFYDL